MQNGSESLKVSLSDLDEDRFSRFSLITWWEQKRLGEANVLVIGAGALGNEILKNLALLGVRRIIVADVDSIEYSNLSRSVLFRPEHVGHAKAAVAATATQSLGHDAIVHPIHANIISQVGLGVFGWADVILAGLDNREARLWINRCAWKMNRPWVDGAIEGVSGVARVFLPSQGPCYECTLGETDWAILEKRMSCNLLTHEEMLGGKTPTTPTTSSVIAGIQVQEMVKLLHGLPVLAGKGFVFEGLRHTSYVTEYTESPDCLSHETFGKIVEFPGTSRETSLTQLLDFARNQLGDEDVVIDFSRDVIHKLICPRCHVEDELFAPVGTVTSAQGRCVHDGVMREVISIHGFSGQESFGAYTLDRLGLPAFDVFIARSADQALPILIAGDRGVLGPLAEFRPTVWDTVQPVYQNSRDEPEPIAAREVIHV